MAVKPNEGKLSPKAADAADEDARHVWAYIKSHWKEIGAIAGSVITTVTGATVWVAADFATQDQVTRMECILSTNITIQSLPLELALIKFQLDETTSEASNLEGRLKVTYTAADSRILVYLS
jgi:hypothetical protein